MSSDERFSFWFGAVLGAAFALTLSVPFWCDHIDASHRELGSKGHACFANHTCRENLKCLVADGIDATCVKP